MTSELGLTVYTKCTLSEFNESYLANNLELKESAVTVQLFQNPAAGRGLLKKSAWK